MLALPAGQHGVTVISWLAATAFCDWLTKKEGHQYRLPSDTEWTAAMQLGIRRLPISKKQSTGVEPRYVEAESWFDAKQTHPLGIVLPNDTFAEWTQAPFGEKILVQREVSEDGRRFHCEKQYWALPSFRAADVGFRVVAETLTLAPRSVEELPPFGLEHPTDSPE